MSAIPEAPQAPGAPGGAKSAGEVVRPGAEVTVPGRDSRVGELSWALAKRDLQSRYLRSQLGAFLTVLQPLLWLATAVIAFYGLMGAGVDRGGGAGGGWLGYAARTAAALAVWLPIAECWGRAPNGFAAQAPLVRRTLFPLKAIPLALCWAAAVTGGLCLLLALGFGLAVPGTFNWGTPIYLAVGVALTAAWMLAGSYFLAAVGIFFRDLNSLIGHFLTLGMLVTPVYYDASIVPARWQWAVQFNPLAAPALILRAAFGGGLPATGWSLGERAGFSAAAAFLALAAARWVFRRLSGRIAEQI